MMKKHRSFYAMLFAYASGFLEVVRFKTH